MSPDADLMQTLEDRRYIALTEREAAELGSGPHGEWLRASRHGVHVDARDYLELMRDGSRWRGLCSGIAKVGIGFGVVAASFAFIFLLGLLARVLN